MSRAAKPPRFAAWLLERALPPGIRGDAIRGDLLEELRTRPGARGDWWYARQALSLSIRYGWDRARRRLAGAPHSHKTRRSPMLLEAIWQDVRYAVRSYAKAPTFTIIMLTTLALGIGASTAIFSMVDGILLRPLPFADPDRLIWINEVNPRGGFMSVSWPNFIDWRERVRSFEQLAATRTNFFTLTGRDQARRIDGRRVTANFFDVLGVRPSVGRGFTEADDRAGAEAVAIVSDGFWRRELGGDGEAIGQQIVLDARPFTIVGVLPAGFRYVRDTDVWVAMGPVVADPILRERGNHPGYIALGRLKPGVTLEAASRELDAIQRDLGRQYPLTNSGVGARLELLSARIVNTVRQTLLVLFGAVGCLLIIACVNVANLLVARGAARQHELAVRAALGGGRLRLVTQLLVESSLVSAAGGLLGVAFGAGLLRLLVAMAPDGTPRLDEVHLNPSALLFAFGAAAACGVVFGAFPAMQVTSVSGQQVVIRGRTAGASARSHRLRRGLMVVEVALALVLLTGAGLMIRTVAQLMRVDLGFRPDHLLTLQLSFRGQQWTPEKRIAFLDDAFARVRALPGVASIGAVLSLPIDGSQWNSVFVVEGQPAPANRDLIPVAAMTPASAGYFETMGMRLVRGRLFTPADGPESSRVVVINEQLARRVFGGADPIGKRIKQGWPETSEKISPWREVVGVVGDVKFDGLTEMTPMQAYFPFPQSTTSDVTLVVRTDADPASLQSAVEAAVHALDRDMPLYQVRTMDRVLETSIARQRMAVLVLVVFAVVALTLASVGLYGVVAHGVTERTHEIGVRIALGAERRHVLGLVARQGLSMAALGTAIGIVGAVALSRWIEGLLFGVTATDPATIAAVVATLFTVALVACYVPAWRATRVDPTQALRTE
jgi:putative ABC transport system permease protein